PLAVNEDVPSKSREASSGRPAEEFIPIAEYAVRAKRKSAQADVDAGYRFVRFQGCFANNHSRSFSSPGATYPAATSSSTKTQSGPCAGDFHSLWLLASTVPANVPIPVLGSYHHARKFFPRNLRKSIFTFNSLAGK